MNIRTDDSTPTHDADDVPLTTVSILVREEGQLDRALCAYSRGGLGVAMFKKGKWRIYHVSSATCVYDSAVYPSYSAAAAGRDALVDLMPEIDWSGPQPFAHLTDAWDCRVAVDNAKRVLSNQGGFCPEMMYLLPSR